MISRNQRFGRGRVLAVALTLLTAALPATAQTTAVGAEARNAGERAERSAPANKTVELVEVVGRQPTTEFAADLGKYGNSVQVIEAEQIEVGGYINIAEAVQFLVRGANVGYSPDEGEYTLRLDGGGDRDTLVLLDGVPLFDRGPALETIWGATIVDVHMIERIEVYRGGQSLYFGSNGGVGVINLITKQPDGSSKGEFGVSYGDFNTRELWGNLSFPLDAGGQHSLMLYGSNNSTDGPRIFDPALIVDNIARAGGIHEYPLNRNNLGAKYLWRIDGSSELRVNAQYAQIEFRDAFPHTTVYAPNTTEYPMIDAAFRKDWSTSFSTEAEIYYTNPQLFNTELFPVVCRIESGCPDANNPDTTVPFGQWTGAVEAYRNQGFDQVKGGYEELTASIRNRIWVAGALEMVVGLQSVNYRNDSAAVFNIDDDVASINGVYLDLRPRLPFAPSTSISLAGRTDFADAFGSKTIWKFGFRQPFAEGFYLRANGGTSYSLPQTNELFASTETFVGNPDLKPEETETYNAGLGFEGDVGDGRLQAEIGAIRTDITDRIRSTTDQQPNTRFNDPSVTEIRGLTADLQYAFGRSWSASLSYTKIDAAPEATGVQINETPEWMVIGSLNYRSPSERYHFSLLPRWQGPEFVAGGGLRENFGDYMVMNASFGYWTGGGRDHRFQLRIVNLLDKDYAERAGIGDQRFGEAFIRGEITRDDPEYFFPYFFEGKPRSVFVSYSYRY